MRTTGAVVLVVLAVGCGGPPCERWSDPHPAAAAQQYEPCDPSAASPCAQPGNTCIQAPDGPHFCGTPAPTCTATGMPCSNVPMAVCVISNTGTPSVCLPTCVLSTDCPVGFGCTARVGGFCEPSPCGP